jgi:predicted nuclease of restriction endonuclease-like RecB superfamily
MSKKTQIAKLILEMTVTERWKMAADIVDLQSNAADDDDGYQLDNKVSVSNMLRDWAKGLGSME